MSLIPVSKEKAIEVCKMGQGADCCIWLVVGAKGFECMYHHKDTKSLTGESHRERWERGDTVAKRDGCDEMRKTAKDRTAVFHAHLDVCSQCRNHPFGLCTVGAKLLKEAATGPQISE